LPLWTFALSFLAQTHTAQVPICLALCIPVIFAAFIRARDAGIRDLLRPIMLSGLLAFVVWASPLYDLLRNDGGNLARLYQFYTTPRVGHTIQEVATTIRALIADAFPGPVAVWVLLLCASIVMLIVDAMVNAFRAPGRFSGILLLVAAAFVLSIFRIPTQIAEYYLIHFHIIAVLIFIGGIGALARTFSATRLAQLTGVVAGALALHGLAFRADDFRGSEWNRFPYGQIVRIGEVIADSVSRCGRPAVVRTLGSLQRANVPSFLYVLRQLEVPLATSDSGGPIFTIYAPAGEAPASVVDGEIVLRTRSYVLVRRPGACGPVPGRARSGAARILPDLASRASPQNTGSAAGRDNINRSCDFS
jgi:hypothetical protein